jgi:hypothetical protein
MNMIGLTRNNSGQGADRVVSFDEDPKNPWRLTLGQERLDDLRKSILMAPPRYSNRTLEFQSANGTEKVRVSALLHHKVVVSGDSNFITGSFNFSQSALENQEQILWIFSPTLTRKMIGAYDYLDGESRTGATLSPDQLKQYTPYLYERAINKNPSGPEQRPEQRTEQISSREFSNGGQFSQGLMNDTLGLRPMGDEEMNQEALELRAPTFNDFDFTQPTPQQLAD